MRLAGNLRLLSSRLLLAVSRCLSFVASAGLLCLVITEIAMSGEMDETEQKQRIDALYIPLADHYAAIVAYERYAASMQHADFRIKQLPNWNLLRAHFYEGRADMAFVMSPLAMDMYAEMQNFRWVGLMHRDGNALAINDVIAEEIVLSQSRLDRKPNKELAQVLKRIISQSSQQLTVGVPHVLSTHSVVLHTYLNEFGITVDTKPNNGGDVLIHALAPPRAPIRIKSLSNKGLPAAFEQSLPWADIVETQGYGKVAWYSKDVIQWPKGHVECIAIATDKAIEHKSFAVQEVMAAIHQAGEDIEQARGVGGESIEAIVQIVQKHIPTHGREAILASLDPRLRVINYQDLNIDKAGLRHIMELAVKANILKQPIDIEAFSAPQFRVEPESTECCSD